MCVTTKYKVGGYSMAISTISFKWAPTRWLAESELKQVVYEAPEFSIEVPDHAWDTWGNWRRVADGGFYLDNAG